jgi:CheY-like chemotaxis protein
VRFLHNNVSAHEKPILIVDDNIFNIVAIQTLLEGINPAYLQSDLALNGQQAVEKVAVREAESEYHAVFVKIKTICTN